MITSDIYAEIKEELRGRNEWEDRQATWYDMRFTGIKRLRKPYPNAPDTHYPLADTLIDKLRPFYLAQLYGQERLASFSSGKPQAEQMTATAEKFFDYMMKQRTNFERAIFTAVDHMLMYGRGPLKVYWCVEEQELRFSPIRPIYIIVPAATEELCDADWLVHVMHMSETQYRANENFKQDDAFIKSIKGRGNENDGNSVRQEQNILRRQGITYGQNDRQIVLWEVYTREGGKVEVDTFSPILGIKSPARETFGLPYKHRKIPIVDVRYEITDQDYYSPRGIPEIVAQHELDLCKLWNHKLQYLDYHGQPTYKNNGTIGAAGNFKAEPGKILPPGIEPNQPQSAPLDFQIEMQLQRSLAEDRVQVPDLGANNHQLGKKKGAEETATGINAIMAQSGAGNDMRARVFRLQLAMIFKQAWSLFIQFAPKKDLVLEDYTDVPPEVMHDEYRISPSGSADSYSKEKRVAKALAYYQTMQGNPCIRVPEMTKWVFEQEDSALVKRLVQDPADLQQDEAENQSVETLLMMNDRQPRVHPSDDDKAHVADMANWVQHRMQTGLPITPAMAGQLLQHSQAHAQQIMQKKDKEGMALIKELQPIASMLQQIAQPQPQLPPHAPPGAPPPMPIAA